MGLFDAEPADELQRLIDFDAAFSPQWGKLDVLGAKGLAGDLLHFQRDQSWVEGGFETI